MKTATKLAIIAVVIWFAAAHFGAIAAGLLAGLILAGWTSWWALRTACKTRGNPNAQTAFADWSGYWGT